MPNSQYTHLKKDEKAIAKRFRAQYYFPGEWVYDVHLDVPVPVLPAWWTKKDRDSYVGNRAKRIDLLIKGPKEHLIIEITPKLSKPAVGGCLLYKDLYLEQLKPDVPVKLGIVVEVDDSAYHKTCRKNNITWWVV